MGLGLMLGFKLRVRVTVTNIRVNSRLGLRLRLSLELGVGLGLANFILFISTNHPGIWLYFIRIRHQSLLKIHDKKWKFPF